MKFVVPPLRSRTVREVLTDCETDKSWSQLKNDMDLGEDLLQAEYPNGLTLDVGWYDDSRDASTTANPEAGGVFCVVCIRDHDWDNPVLTMFARDFVELRRAIEAADAWISELAS
jgi:hypothetical protein